MKRKRLSDDEVFLHIWFRKGRDKDGTVTYTERSKRGMDQARWAMLKKYPLHFTKEARAYYGFTRTGKRARNRRRVS